MLAFIHHLLSPMVHFLKGFERKGRIYLYGTKKRYPISSKLIGSYFTLGKLVLYALIAVSLCYALDITVSKDVLNFFKRDLFFTPPMVEHAMKFPVDSVFITLGKGSRSKINYDNDTHKVDLV